MPVTLSPDLPTLPPRPVRSATVRLPTDLPTLLKQLRAEGVSDFEVEGTTVRVRFFERAAVVAPGKKNPVERKLAAVSALKGFDFNPDQFE